jgi:hypothetical protein
LIDDLLALINTSDIVSFPPVLLEGIDVNLDDTGSHSCSVSPNEDAKHSFTFDELDRIAMMLAASSLFQHAS